MARNHRNTSQPFPRIADFGSGKPLAQRYPKIQKEMRPCVSGLMDYAANLALAGEQNLIPDLREMVVSIGPFWEDSGDKRPGWRQAREQHYGETFDQVLSAAQESGQAPVMDGKKIEQIFAGLNYHAEERAADLDTYSIWQCCRICRRLQQEWEGKTNRPLVFNGGFEVDYSDTFTNFGSKSPEDLEYGGLFGKPVLIFNHPIDPENIPHLWHCYHLTGKDIVHPDKLVDALPEEGYKMSTQTQFTHTEACTLIAHEAVSMLDSAETELPQCIKEFRTARTITETCGMDDLLLATIKSNVTALAKGRHTLLMKLRGQVPGNFRQLLSETPDGMSVPLKINDGLYLESKFDTQALLENLTQKVLRRVGYDCGGVAVLYQPPRQEAVMDDKPDQAGGLSPPAGPTM